VDEPSIVFVVVAHVWQPISFLIKVCLAAWLFSWILGTGKLGKNLNAIEEQLNQIRWHMETSLAQEIHRQELPAHSGEAQKNKIPPASQSGQGPGS
jgi:hypothetical protein